MQQTAAYCPRSPESTVLYSVVAQNLETFLARRQASERPVPGWNFERIWIVEFWNEVSFASVAKSAVKTGCLDSHVRIAAFAGRVAGAE
jgi:hypothetical protein